MKKVFRLLTRILVIIGLLLVLAVLLIGIISTAINWQGVCDLAEGATEPCSWFQFALGEMFWSLFLFIPYFFLAALSLLGMSLYQFFRSLVQRSHKAKQGG
jgi:hypothetical protein